MTGRLEGKVALVTGSDSGIGAACAIEFAKEGADVVVTYFKDEDGADMTKKEVEAQGRKAVAIQVDVSVEAEVEALFKEALGTFSTIDILVNNAGVDASGKNVVEMPTEIWDKAIRTNLYGFFYTCRRFIDIRQRAGGKGKIINISSVHDEIPRAGAADYDCSKSAIQALTRTLSLELAPDKINVNSFPWKRAAEPKEIGWLAVYLASDQADYVTGATYYIDGGLMQYQGQGA